MPKLPSTKSATIKARLQMAREAKALHVPAANKKAETATLEMEAQPSLEKEDKAMEKEDTDGQHRPTSPSSCQTWDGECSSPPFNDNSAYYPRSPTPNGEDEWPVYKPYDPEEER